MKQELIGQPRVNADKALRQGMARAVEISHDYVSFVDIGPFEWRFMRDADPDAAAGNIRCLHRYALPMICERGFAEANITQLLAGNPRVV
jgi:phosphotriesterase-related protein